MNKKTKKKLFKYLIKGYEFADMHNLDDKVNVIIGGSEKFVYIMLEGFEDEIRILKTYFYNSQINHIQIGITEHSGALNNNIKFGEKIQPFIKSSFPKEYRLYNLEKLLK